jgi:hypothetical protein
MRSALALEEKMQQKTQVTVSTAYLMFLLCSVVVYWLVANGEFTCILTLSVMLQCLANVFLVMQVVVHGTSTGVSSRSLWLDAIALIFRLASTTWLNGYLPVDASGDHAYNLAEGTSLAMVLWLISQVRGKEDCPDTFPIHWLFIASAIIGVFLHADMNNRPIFDGFWMFSLWLSSTAALPQMWLITQRGGKVEAFTCHRVALMALSKMLSCMFMWHAREDITCHRWFKGFNHAVAAIIGAHLLHLVVLGDFAYFYVKSLNKYGFKWDQMDLLELDV